MRRCALAAFALCALMIAAARAEAPGETDAGREPYFVAHVKLAPGHYIDRDTGLDCEDAGIVTACAPPDGTVRYFDPVLNARCARTGAAALCSN